MNRADVTLGKYLFGLLKENKDQQTYLINVDVVERTRVALWVLRRETSYSESLNDTNQSPVVRWRAWVQECECYVSNWCSERKCKAFGK